MTPTAPKTQLRPPMDLITTPAKPTELKPNNPSPGNYLDSSKFHVRVYQDLEEGVHPIDLPALSAAVIDYEFNEDLAASAASGIFHDDYFPGRFGDEDEDEDSEEEDSDQDEDEDSEEDYEEDPVYYVVLSYYVNRDVIREIHGAFPLPSDANLVVEITHFDTSGSPVFRHTFRGWPSPAVFRKASVQDAAPLIHTINLECESTKVFELLHTTQQQPQETEGESQ